MTSPRILILVGSQRRESLNQQLAQAAEQQLNALGASCTLINPRLYELPLYDGDLEAASGLPANAIALQRLLTEHDSLLIVSPEYNGLPTPLLINTIDWMSRKSSDFDGMSIFKHKATALLSASPGGLGGMRSLNHVRQLLTNLGAWVIPEQFALGGAASAFADNGTLTDARNAQQLQQIASHLLHFIQTTKQA